MDPCKKSRKDLWRNSRIPLKIFDGIPDDPDGFTEKFPMELLEEGANKVCSSYVEEAWHGFRIDMSTNLQELPLVWGIASTLIHN